MISMRSLTRAHSSFILFMLIVSLHLSKAFVVQSNHILKTMTTKSLSFPHNRSVKPMKNLKVRDDVNEVSSSSSVSNESNTIVRMSCLHESPSSCSFSLVHDYQGFILALGSATVVAVLFYHQPDAALAATAASTTKSLISTGSFDPNTFRPVCPASDSVYRFLQLTTQSLVGDDSFVQYSPLIAEGLLRIRLELCVVESYFNEAVGPFIQREGLSWVLPLHETVETFLAGTIFSLATTFILVGSTKIVSVLMTYADFFIGGPCRLLGGFAYDRSRGRPVTLDIGFGPFKKRLIGPGSPQEEEMLMRKKFIEGTNIIDEIKEELDWSNVEPKTIPVVVLSGGVKLFGETFKVCLFFGVYMYFYVYVEMEQIPSIKIFAFRKPKSHLTILSYPIYRSLRIS